jgi:hypothetical protein
MHDPRIVENEKVTLRKIFLYVFKMPVNAPPGFSLKDEQTFMPSLHGILGNELLRKGIVETADIHNSYNSSKPLPKTTQTIIVITPMKQ